MVNKRKPGKKQVKVGELTLKKETIKDLTAKDAQKVNGGGALIIRTGKTLKCETT